MDHNIQINRRNFLKTSALITAGALCGCTIQNQKISGTKGSPNILFIFADDQEFRAIGALGGKVKTPNLDRLVNKGVTFTHAYNQGSWSGAVCIASRCMLNTGKYLWNAEKTDVQEQKNNGLLWSQIIKKAGYDTYFTGKWHVKCDPKEVFDYTGSVRPGMPNTVEAAYNRPVENQPDNWSAWDKSIGGYWEGGTHWSEVVGNDGTDFINSAAKRNNPFFMYLAFNAPHDPRQSPKEFVDKYPLTQIDLPQNFQPEYPYKDDIGCPETLRDERLAPFPRTEYSVKVHLQEYYAIITHMDEQIGRILNALDENNLTDNTYIFFTADHGLAVGQHGLMGKQNMYDHSVRVPLIVSGPSIEQGEINTPVYLQDIAPTTMELAGVDKPNIVEFNSLMPMIKSGKKSSYQAIYGGYLDLQRMVSYGKFKLIVYPKIGKVLLYNTDKDPYEMENLAEMPEYAVVKKKLFSKLLKLQTQIGDKLDLKAVFTDLSE